MFCPRCSQEQASDEMKYCSRCGFLLKDVSQALQNEGLVRREENLHKVFNKRDVWQGLIVMFLSIAFVFFLLIIGVPEPSSPIMFAILAGFGVFLLGAMWLGYNLLFKPSEAEAADETAVRNRKNLTGAETNYLPPGNENASIPVEMSFKAPATNELAERPSVTEATTKFLE